MNTILYSHILQTININNLSAEGTATRSALQDILTKNWTSLKESRGHAHHTKATFNKQRQTFSLTGLETGHMGLAIDFTSLTFVIISAILSGLVMLGGAILADKRPFTVDNNYNF